MGIHQASPPAFACSVCAVRAHSACKALATHTEMRDLQSTRLGCKRFAAGEAIYLQGDTNDGVCTLLSGWALLTQTLEDGRRQIVRILMPSDMFGTVSAGLHDIDHGAEAIVPATICLQSKAKISDLRHRYPQYCEGLMEAVEENALMTMELVTDLGCRNGTERVVRLLFGCLERMRKKGLVDQQSMEADIPLSQTIIGEAVGLTSIHVNRILRGLRQAGVLCFNRGHLQILDMEKAGRILDSGTGGNGRQSQYLDGSGGAFEAIAFKDRLSSRMAAAE